MTLTVKFLHHAKKKLSNTCQKYFFAGMIHRFVSAKRLIRCLLEFSSKLVEIRAQSTVREFKMLAVWSSTAEGFLIACS